MLIVVSYDVVNDRRRNKIAKVLEGHGQRVQWSVFECDLTTRQLEQLKHRLQRLLDDKEDSIRYYRLCADCVKRIEFRGGPPVERTPSYYIV